MFGLPTWLLSPRLWGAVAIGAVVIGVMLYVGGLYAKIARAERRALAAERSLEIARADLARCQTNRGALVAAVATQSLATATHGARTASALREAQDGLTRAQERHRDDAARLAALRRPLTAGTACERADEAAGRAREALR